MKECVYRKINGENYVAIGGGVNCKTPQTKNTTRTVPAERVGR